MKSNPYLNFRNNSREVLDYYQSVFGGTTTINTFAEFNASDDPEEKNWVMHGQLESPTGIVLMMADTPKSMEYTPGRAMSISIGGEHNEEDALRGYWEKLTDGGNIIMPLETAEWGGLFGMVVDRFGATWMISIGDEGETS
jgi:PhnB protein